MSGEPTQKLSFSERFNEAADRAGDRLMEWLGKHPKTDATAVFTFYYLMLGYNALRAPDRILRNQWFWRMTPLEKFEPWLVNTREKKPEAPYWQDLVFGDGRAEKLVKRLQAVPQVDVIAQKMCLGNSEGGLSILPAHRDLVKYALNDADIARAMSRVDSGVNHMTWHKERDPQIDFDDSVDLIANHAGIRTTTPSKTQIIQQGSKEQYAQMGFENIAGAYQGNGHKNEDVVKYANAISVAVYYWMIEDVLPVVPNLLTAHYGSGYNAIPQKDGFFILKRLPKNYELKVKIAEGSPRNMDEALERLNPANRKTNYEILIDGYRGKVPAYAAKDTAAPAIGPN